MESDFIRFNELVWWTWWTHQTENLENGDRYPEQAFCRSDAIELKCPCSLKG